MSLDAFTGGHGHKRMTNPAKKASITGNYAQILRALTQLDVLKYQKDLDQYLKILKMLKMITGSNDYGKFIRPKDFSEIFCSVCYLYKNMYQMRLTKNQQEEVKTEMRLISQKCSSMMKKMEPLSREIIYSTY